MLNICAPDNDQSQRLVRCPVRPNLLCGSQCFQTATGSQTACMHWRVSVPYSCALPLATRPDNSVGRARVLTLAKGQDFSNISALGHPPARVPAPQGPAHSPRGAWAVRLPTRNTTRALRPHAPGETHHGNQHRRALVDLNKRMSPQLACAAAAASHIERHTPPPVSPCASAARPSSWPPHRHRCRRRSRCIADRPLPCSRLLSTAAAATAAFLPPLSRHAAR